MCYPAVHLCVLYLIQRPRSTAVPVVLDLAAPQHSCVWCTWPTLWPRGTCRTCRPAVHLCMFELNQRTMVGLCCTCTSCPSLYLSMLHSVAPQYIYPCCTSGPAVNLCCTWTNDPTVRARGGKLDSLVCSPNPRTCFEQTAVLYKHKIILVKLDSFHQEKSLGQKQSL